MLLSTEDTNIKISDNSSKAFITLLRTIPFYDCGELSLLKSGLPIPNEKEDCPLWVAFRKNTAYTFDVSDQFKYLVECERMNVLPFSILRMGIERNYGQLEVKSPRYPTEVRKSVVDQMLKGGSPHVIHLDIDDYHGYEERDQTFASLEDLSLRGYFLYDGHISVYGNQNFGGRENSTISLNTQDNKLNFLYSEQEIGLNDEQQFKLHKWISDFKKSIVPFRSHLSSAQNR